MALIKCNECGKEISDQAKICVNCGAPIIKQKIGNIKKKTWEELTQVERQQIVAYRKLKKEWWTSGTRFGSMLFIILGFAILMGGLFTGLLFQFMFLSFALWVIGIICSVSSNGEAKKWYENNVDRLYEEEILK